jgi:hypothetical protein
MIFTHDNRAVAAAVVAMVAFNGAFLSVNCRDWGDHITRVLVSTQR